jgi:hypothetical protein
MTVRVTVIGAAAPPPDRCAAFSDGGFSHISSRLVSFLACGG